MQNGVNEYSHDSMEWITMYVEIHGTCIIKELL